MMGPGAVTVGSEVAEGAVPLAMVGGVVVVLAVIAFTVLVWKAVQVRRSEVRTRFRMSIGRWFSAGWAFSIGEEHDRLELQAAALKEFWHANLREDALAGAESEGDESAGTK
jgi:UDP-N-acetylmuramyl pentapeptide phosphotransferase/UDP-N-acetylglucosamine-1-phosphate transferase